jgi:anti-sigma regulatory factor (Ser/Thr protein kinase)
VLLTILDRRDAARAARRLVAAGCARAASSPECADATELMISEVVTNALLHGAGDGTFGMNAGTASVRVEVGDAGPRRPSRTAAGDGSEGDRGMIIVDALASSWGVADNPPGKIVWLEVPAQP